MSYIEIEGKVRIPVELFQKLGISSDHVELVTAQSNDVESKQVESQVQPLKVHQTATTDEISQVKLDGYDRSFSWMPKNQRQIGEMYVEWLHTGPTIALIHNVLSPEECQELIHYYQHDTRLQRATVHNNETGELSVSEFRTNSLMWLEHGEHPLLTKIDKNMSLATSIPSSHGEKFQMMHYASGEEFKPHDDFFYHLGAQSNFAIVGQRIATAILYLKKPEEGGETSFSELGISVDAKPGTVLYFEYTDGNGVCTTDCRHAGNPVTKGDKWNLTKWYRQRPWPKM
jgi:prolyl 4-hydroxylase